MPVQKNAFSKKREYNSKGWAKKANRKLYDSGLWRYNIREEVKKNQPFCVECLKLNRFVETQVIDHIVPVNQGGDKYSLSNLQGLCTACHNKKSARERGIGGHGNPQA